ncbi:MAG TPA: S41 family peptidase [Gaiellales bacterium]|nr:S41 family peptidase [Gaiellales bacterium]
MGRRVLIWLVAAVSLVIAFLGGFELHTRTVSRMEGPGTAQAATIRDEVVATLRQSYYRPLSPAALHAGDVRDVIRALHDPYTRYLSPHAYQLVVTSEQSSYVGVGLALAQTRGGLLVTGALPGLPAAASGIRAGDVIRQVGSRALARISYGRAVDLLQGPPGQRVSLVIRRRGVAHPVRVTLVRRAVDLPIAITRTIDYRQRRYTYVNLPGFVKGAGARIRQIAERATHRHSAGLILDLRGNVGGLLNEAISVADVFQPTGVVVAIHGLHEPSHVYEADNTAVGHLPVVVLVDGSTASAAEVVAGSLQQARRAEVVGTRSFGKGTVQAVHPLDGGGALKLTVAVFQLAGGEPVNRRGITPDVHVREKPGSGRDDVLAAALRVLARS